MTLRTRLTVAFLAVVVGPVLLGAVFVGGVVTAVSQERATYRLDLAADAVGHAVSSLCQQLRTSAELVAAQPPAERQRLAEDLVASGQVAAVRVRAGGGATVVDTPRPPAAPWADCARSATRAQGYAGIAARVQVAADDSVATVWAAQAVDDALLARLTEVAGVEVLVVADRAGGPATGTAEDLEPGQVARTDDGRWVRRVATTEGQPLPLAVSTPHHHPQSLYALLLGAVILTAGLAFVAAWWLAISTTRPLTELARAADRVADGDLTARVPVRADDEAGQVATAFNRMTHRTSAYVQALTASRDQLRGHLAVLGDTLASTHDLDRILQVILQTARVATGAQAGVVVLRDPESDELTGHHTGPDEAGDEGTRPLTVPLAGSLLGKVAIAGEACRGRLAVDDPRLSDREPRGRTYVAAPISAAASAPAATGEGAPPPTVRGVLALYDRVGGDDFDETDLETLRTFAIHAAAAVDNVRTHEEAQRLSLTDPLTGLWNYRHLQDALRREVERAGRFGRMLTVLALDLDLFKEVNDVYGHPAGDAVLAEFARRIRSEIREVDSAFRQGGEEFVVLLPETDARGGSIVAQRLNAAVRGDPIVITLRAGGERVPVDITVSIGVAVFPDHGLTPEDLLDVADDALYAAKAAGRDTFRLATAVPPAAAAAMPVRPRDGGPEAGTAAEPTGEPEPSGGGAKPPRQSRGR